jgi:hypothetical protein
MDAGGYLRASEQHWLDDAFNGRLTRDNTVELMGYKDDQERRTILEWLTPTDHGTQQSDFVNR